MYLWNIFYLLLLLFIFYFLFVFHSAPVLRHKMRKRQYNRSNEKDDYSRNLLIAGSASLLHWVPSLILPQLANYVGETTVADGIVLATYRTPSLVHHHHRTHAHELPQ